MCRGQARLAGILRGKQAANRQMYGSQGLVLVEYKGEKEGELPPTVYTGLRYPYYPGRKFYVDANDASRVLAYRENGEAVFEVVE